MDEFELIRRHFAGLAPGGEGVVLGIGDDCALLSLPPGMELAVTTDNLVLDRHFTREGDPHAIGWKALAVNLSDLAAMGAQPRAFTLSLTLDRVDSDWLTVFARGLGDAARAHRIALVGGNTTRGALNIGICAMGWVPAAQALRRSGARIGDAVCVTGTLGDAALALRLRGAGTVMPLALSDRLDRPCPRIAAGLALRRHAHAAIDLSDGLAGDLSHLLAASGVGATIDAASLPMSGEFSARADPGARLALQVQGGDDYELCVCLPAATVDAARAELDVPLTVIGRVVAEPGLRFHDATGVTIEVSPHGYRHFE